MADGESGKCDEDGHKVQHWMRTDQSKIYSTIDETVKSTSSDHQQRGKDPLEGTIRNRCRFSISDILSDKHPTSHIKTMGSLVTKTCITTSTTETGNVSVLLPTAVSISDEVPSYITSQLPRYLHAGDFKLCLCILQQSTQNPWFQPWLSTVRPSISQEQNLAHSADKKQAERVHEMSKLL
uniref:Uncharacterized protein n=1 Tax=Onchocerca volvulus TaxID=6282 RepID=A0A8R1TUR7_ONCVO